MTWSRVCSRSWRRQRCQPTGSFPGVVLLTLQPVRRRQGEHQQGEQDVHAHRPRGFLGRMLQTPLLLDSP